MKGKRRKGVRLQHANSMVAFLTPLLGVLFRLKLIGAKQILKSYGKTAVRAKFIFFGGAGKCEIQQNLSESLGAG